GAEQIVVTTRDGRDFAAKILGEDPQTDIAVLKVDGVGLPTAPLGKSTDLLIGEWVVAVGNPFAYLLGNTEPTVTAGVVSAVRRAWVGLEVAGADDLRGWKRAGGLRVTQIAPGGPASRAGVVAGDVLVSARGRRLRTFLDWEAVLLDIGPGDTLVVSYRHEGESRTARLAVTDLPTTLAEKVAVLGGMKVVTVTAAVRAERGIQSDHGALADTIRRVSYYYTAIPDKPGEGTRLLDALRRAGVNLLALHAFPSARKAQVDFVPSDAAVFEAAAKGAKIKLSKPKTAFLLDGDDRVGALAGVLSRL